VQCQDYVTAGAVPTGMGSYQVDCVAEPCPAVAVVVCWSINQQVQAYSVYTEGVVDCRSNTLAGPAVCSCR